MKTENNTSNDGDFAVNSENDNETRTDYRRLVYSLFDDVYVYDYAIGKCEAIVQNKQFLGKALPVGNIDEANEVWINKLVVPEDKNLVSGFVANLQNRNAYDDGGALRVTYRYKSRSGKICWMRNIALFADEHRVLICAIDITEVKEAQRLSSENAVLQAMLAEQEKYRLVVEQTGITVIEWNHLTGEFHYTDSYKKYETSRRDQTAMLNNSGDIDLVYPDDLDILKRFFAAVNEGKQHAEALLRVKMVDGTFRWTKMCGDYIYSPEGKRIKTIGTFIDMDDEIRAKQVLEETGERLQRIISNIPAGVAIYSIDASGEMKTLYFSERTCKMFGYTIKEYNEHLTNKTFSDNYLNFRALSAVKYNKAKDGQSVCIPRVEVSKKDGTKFWVRAYCLFSVKEGEPIICNATLFDITDEVEAERESESQGEIYNMVLESIDTIIYDYQVAKDEITMSVPRSKTGKRETYVYSNYFKYLHGDQSLIHKEYRDKVLEVIKTAVKEPKKGNLEVLVTGFDGNLHWYRIKYASIADSFGNVYRIVGKIDMLDDIMFAQQAKLLAARTDKITGLTNKDTARIMVEKELKERPVDRYDVMMFMDVDNFKNINDTSGHLSGDKILAKIGSILKLSFVKGDITSRFGGDEFLIYCKNAKNIDNAVAMAEKAIKKISAIKAPKGVEVHCSVGIVEIVGKHRGFDHWYANVDSALYSAKQHGKNRVSIFNSEGDIVEIEEKK